MPIQFAINGLGRIGRCLARIAHLRPELECVAVNDRASAADMAHWLRYDSVHGRFPGQVDVRGQQLLIDGYAVQVFREALPTQIPWQDTAARIVVEATGAATSAPQAKGHLRPDGPSKVLISALASDVDLTLCLGINERSYDPANHHVISNASCTTNCLALLLDVLDREFEVRSALMNEVHSYTSDQRLVDGGHRDLRRGRASGMNIVPTSTAAPAAVEQLLPHLAGRLGGHAVRVPTPDGALLDLVAVLAVQPDEVQLLAAFEQAAADRLQGLLAVCHEPLVSSDHLGNPHSAIIDAGLIHTSGGGLCRVAAWYDNEWGYAHRLADALTLIGESL